MRLAFVVLGTLLGLMVGVIPGIGGLVGLSLLLPFTFAMDPFTALAFLVGVSAVTTTSDTIPAVLFGVPGTTGSAATVLDGHPMARQGQASRALGAAFSASVIGGLFGALILAVSVPVIRPFILSVSTPVMLTICLLGLTLVVTLSKGAMVKGLIAAAVGLLLATIGDEAQTGTMRWTFGTFYLWDGLSLVAVALGLFAVPEMLDLGASKRKIARDDVQTDFRQQFEGVRDTLRNWWLVLRCSSIGTLLGSIPGVGANVIDWVAYGFAAQVTKNSSETFGKGDVRGVIASESSNNAKEGGSLVPTLAFGVPGSATMAILLGAFLIHGISPGPDMLGPRLDVTFTLIWTVALANILGAGLCLLLAGQFAKLALIRGGILVPLIFSVMTIGAYQASRSLGDLAVLLIFGIIGWMMKRLDWPRAPLILAFVLGALIENYLFISVLRYEFAWVTMPVPATLLTVMALMLLTPMIKWAYASLTKRRDTAQSPAQPAAVPRPDGAGVARRADHYADIILLVGVIGLFSYVLWSSWDWRFSARMMPHALSYAGLLAGGLLALGFLTGRAPRIRPSTAEPLALVLRQMAWLVGLLVSIRLVGMLPAIALFGIVYMLTEGRTRWHHTLLIVVPFVLALYLLFQNMLNIPWPQSLLGDLFPALRATFGRIL
ncbi:tripartite tricarboxylate transporter permease [Alkalilacustris brevis]|uniref:tripartite tricarboxylate transporter permease n=1 Tax=Alkalilacustris brevis TaxID=2026338 RepID=UPI001EE3DE97|nr:tripartite tricarboxylate transporter permease [Alkalilacustris brevis]